MRHPIHAMIDLADLQVFLAVGRNLSFVRAARATGTPTSSVSRAVARLEQRLGTRLLHRTSRRVSPTPEGAWLLARAAPLSEELSSVLEEMMDRDAAPAGRLRVTAPLMSGAGRVGRALIDFAAAHPRVQVELQLTNSVLNLVEAGLDLAFRAGPVTDGDLVARRLWSMPYVLAAAPSFVQRELGGKKKLSAKAIGKVTAVVSRAGVPWRFVATDGTLTEVQPNEQFAVTDPRVAVEAAKAGLGVVRAPLEIIEGDAALLRLSCELGELEPRELFAVYPSRRLLPARVRAAIEWVRKGG